MRLRERSLSLLTRAARGLASRGEWFAYVVVAILCTKYLNGRAQLVPKWGQWYMASEGHPYVLLQVRSFLRGKLALVSHPAAAGNDYVWGRGGMQNNFGIGVPLLATPFNLLGRLFGAPGFPDDVLFLILYAATTVLLARALHQVSRRNAGALAASCAAAGFVMVFPTFVGMISSRFLIYEQTVAIGALWSVALLAGVLAIVRRCTTLRLVVVCGAAGFAAMVRIPLAAYGVMTVVIAIIAAKRQGARRTTLAAGLLAFAVVTGLYLLSNERRFGSPWKTGYENIIAGAFVDRLQRWGLPFARVPWPAAVKEMFATTFLLEPVSYQIMMGEPPESVRPFILHVGDRFREYYSPGYDLFVFALLCAAVVIVGARIVVRRLWRADRDLRSEVPAVVGAWALPTAIVIFFFYARMGQMVTRYLVDMYPAFVAAALSVGMATVDAVRRWAPRRVGAARLVIASGAALYLAGWRGWAEHLSHPVDQAQIKSVIASIDEHDQWSHSVPAKFRCGEPRGESPVHLHLDDWSADCTFRSGMVFAMPHSRCVSFTFRPGSGQWNDDAKESLTAFRVNADFDRLVSCGPALVEGDERLVTFCDPKRPPFLLDGMRLYAVASLDKDFNPIDRLKLMQIAAAPSCPAPR